MAVAPDAQSLFGDSWAERPHTLFVRPECGHDDAFLLSLYGSTREAELAQVDWPEAAKMAFVRHQFEAQRSQYRQHYVGAEFLIIERADACIGRLYLHRTRAEVRLMDISLIPQARGKGLGQALMLRLLAWTDQLALPLSLHVEPFNPAQRLYQRLGFTTREIRGVYHFMVRDPPAANAD